MIYAYWFVVAALIIAQVLGYISLSYWVFFGLIAAPFVVWLVVVAAVAVVAVSLGE